MTRWRFLAYYIPSALACWGLSNLVGIRNGTGASAAIGWGGGLLVAVAAIFVGSYLSGGPRPNRVSRQRDVQATQRTTASAALDTEAAGEPLAPAPVASHHEDVLTLKEMHVIEFESDAHEKAYHDVLLWVTQLFGESAWVNDKGPTFSLPIGEKGVGIGIQAYGDDSACVDFWVWPLGETPLAADAYEWALRLNSQYRFGALNIQPEGWPMIEHIALFEGMTKNTFADLVYMISRTADQVLLEYGSRFMGGNLVE